MNIELKLILSEKDLTNKNVYLVATKQERPIINETDSASLKELKRKRSKVIDENNVIFNLAYWDGFNMQVQDSAIGCRYKRKFNKCTKVFELPNNIEL